MEKANDNTSYQPTTIGKPNPLAGAKLWLGKRLVEKSGPDGVEYRLDGRPTNLSLIMQAYNRLRVNAGAEQITVNSSWKVSE